MKRRVPVNRSDQVIKLRMVHQQWKRPTGKLRTLGIVTTGAAAFCLGYALNKHQNTFYRSFVMPAVRILPAETGHNLAVWSLKHKIFPAVKQKDDLNLHSLFCGSVINNPIGIAAGFDKNGEAIEGLHGLGFGFVEVGTVTPGPQEGNPMPRVFRLEHDRAIINRYGFNSEGHDKVLERVRAVKENPDNKIVVGVNLGRNRHSENTADDYVKGVGVFGPVADYLVINVSSPNTEGLRDLQRKNQLENLLESVNKARESLDIKFKKIPIFLKLSPDLEAKDVKDVITVISKSKYRVDGLIVSNTTTARKNLKETKLAIETGGLSGEPLRQRSTEMISLVYDLTKGKVPIIGVGGISSGSDAYQKIEAGASYLQFYTVLVYEGPGVVERIKKELTAELNKHGYANVQEAVGKNYKKYLPNKN